MNVSVAIDKKSNFIQARSNRMVVYDVALLEFLLKNKTYRPIIEATKSVKGQQLFVPFIFDIIQNKKLSLVKVYPKDAEWVESTDFNGKPIYKFVPSNPVHYEWHSHWVEVNRIFTAEMLRMQETVLNGQQAVEFVMEDFDKIKPMSAAVKEKYGEFVTGRDYRTSSLCMVYFMPREEEPTAVGVVYQESFAINPDFRVAKKRKSEEEEGERKED